MHVFFHAKCSYSTMNAFLSVINKPKNLSCYFFSPKGQDNSQTCAYFTTLTSFFKVCFAHSLPLEVFRKGREHFFQPLFKFRGDFPTFCMVMHMMPGGLYENGQ